MGMPRLITPSRTRETADDNPITVHLAFPGDNDVLVTSDDMARVKPRHLFIAAAVLTRMANKAIDAAEMANMLNDDMIAAARNGGKPQ